MKGWGRVCHTERDLLCSLKTELLDPGDTGPAMVEVENAIPVSDVSVKISKYYSMEV